MSTPYAKELPDRRRGGERIDGSRWYQRTYLAEIDRDAAVLGGVPAVLAIADLPSLGASYNDGVTVDEGAFLMQRSPQQVRGSKTIYHVELRYDSQVREETLVEDPRLWDPIVSFPESRDTPRPLVGTLINSTAGITTIPFDGAITNAAGDLPDPYPTDSEKRSVLVIQRNQEVFDPRVKVAFENAVNADWYFGLPPRKWKVDSITTPGRQNAKVGGVKVYYYPTTYRLLPNALTWDYFLLNEGPNYIESGARKPFTADGIPYVDLLTSTGGRLFTTSSTVLPADRFSSATFRRYSAKRELPFAFLNLPNSMP